MDYSGEFCTRRNSKGLVELSHAIESALQNNQKITINRSGVKILSISYVDELLSPLALKYGIDNLWSCLDIQPVLEDFYIRQVELGANRRKTQGP